MGLKRGRCGKPNNRSRIGSDTMSDFILGLTHPHKTGLQGKDCHLLINTTQAISLSNVGLNPPLHTQHNEGVGGCNEGNSNAAIRQMGADRNEGGISNTPPHAQAQWA
ncbi:unnamed protein product [Trifolium pratense]|uniref:Uncharacterized protein n=1 Tax=Trifolium pratense TaxID=57577 RepID=A0ACB0JVA2_TRIPR|nr:unnamed protein product [Trifolium pratense]